MKLPHLALLVNLVAVPAWAQTSAYQSADGNTSIYLHSPFGGLSSLTFNVSTTKFSLGLLGRDIAIPPSSPFRKVFSKSRAWFYGFQVSGNPSTDFATVFQENKPAPDGDASASVGLHHLFTPPPASASGSRDDWILLQITYSRSSFQTVKDALTEPQKRDFDGYKALFAYNVLLPVKGSILAGFASGLQRSNNVDSLKSVNIEVPVLQSTGGIPAFEVTQSKSGYLGIYQRYLAAPIYSDLIWIPSGISRIGIDAFTRSNAAHSNRYVEGGIGVFLSKASNKPTEVLGGLSLAWRNGTPHIGFVAGFSRSSPAPVAFLMKKAVRPAPGLCPRALE